MSSKTRADRRGRWVIASVLMVMGTVSCGGSPPSSPSSPYVGRWSGRLVDSAAGDGTWQMTLTEPSLLSGSGTVAVGEVVASGVAVELPPPPGTTGRYLHFNCGPNRGSLLLHVTVAGNSIAGTYDSLGCGGFSSGTMRGQRE